MSFKQLKKGFLFAVLCLLTSSMKQQKSAYNGVSIEISWFTELKGDFDFANDWEYAPHIEENEFDQIVCTVCPPRAEKMFNRNRRVISDSLPAFYTLVDSTRHYRNLSARCTAYEWSEAKTVYVRKYGDFIIEGHTENDTTSKSRIFFRIKDNLINAWIYYKPDANTTKIFPMSGGKFFADAREFAQGRLKATFSLTFQNEGSKIKALYFSGKMYAKIQ